MINLLRAELYTLRSTAALTLCVLVTTVAAALYLWLQHQLALGALAPASAGGVSGLSDLMLVYLLGSLLIGIIVARPFETKSVHSALLAAGRGAFVTSKAVVATLVVVLLTLPYGVATAVARATGVEIAAALPVSFALIGAEPRDLGTGEVAGLTVVTAVVYAARLAVCLPLAFLVQRPVVVMAVAFVGLFVVDLLAGAAADIPGLDVLVSLTPYAVDHMPTPATTGLDLLATTVVSLAFIAVMGVVAWLLFRRADVK